MVDFFDIHFNADWIWAEAFDCVSKARGHVKVNRHTEEFWTDCTEKNLFRRAMVHVLVDVREGKLEQGSNRRVYWG